MVFGQPSLGHRWSDQSRNAKDLSNWMRQTLEARRAGTPRGVAV